MHVEITHTYKSIEVRGTQILAISTRQQYPEKIALIIRDSMVQSVGLLDGKGTLAYKFVELQEGTIEVPDSDLGGALFKIRLPASHLLLSSNQLNSESVSLGSADNHIIKLHPIA